MTSRDFTKAVGARRTLGIVINSGGLTVLAQQAVSLLR
jgi:hypothetical protein